MASKSIWLPLGNAGIYSKSLAHTIQCVVVPVGLTSHTPQELGATMTSHSVKGPIELPLGLITALVLTKSPTLKFIETTPACNMASYMYTYRHLLYIYRDTLY